ncbi:MAG: hypothetical protein V1729_04390 [Candidatus Woesearchaeota archaeon]
MALRRKSSKPIVLYKILQEYEKVTEDIAGLRRLVSLFYTKLNAKEGEKVRISEAKNSRVEHVAKSLYNTASDLYHDLTEDEQLMLDGLLKIYDSRGAEKESNIERLCIQIEHVPDSDITERVELAAIQVLWRGLSIEPDRKYEGPLFDKSRN